MRQSFMTRTSPRLHLFGCGGSNQELNDYGKQSCWRWARWCLLAAAWCAVATGAFASEFRCGMAVVDVTPERLPVIRNGGFLEAVADRVTDPLSARCVALDDGHCRVAIVVVDSCMIPRAVCDEAKRIAAAETDVPVDRILISATHTHSAPSVMDHCLGSRADRQYREMLPAKVAKCVVAAVGKLAPAEAAWLAVDVPDMTFNRRWVTRHDRAQLDPFGESTVRAMMHPGYQNPDYTHPSGPVDSALTLLALRSVDGTPIGLLANYSMHYFGSQSGISADYYGHYVRKLQQDWSAGASPCVAIMSQGTSGDLWRGDYRCQPSEQSYSRIVAYADALAERTHAALTQAQWRQDVEIDMRQRELDLRRRAPSEQRLAWARRMNALRGDRRPQNRPEVYALQAEVLANMPHDAILLQAIRIGDLALTAMPNEVYALTGLKLKYASPFAVTANVSLANGASGYIPPPEQHLLGGYTTWPATTAGLEVDAEPKIVASLLEMLAELAGAPAKQYREPRSDYSRHPEFAAPPTSLATRGSRWAAAQRDRPKCSACDFRFGSTPCRWGDTRGASDRFAIRVVGGRAP